MKTLFKKDITDLYVASDENFKNRTFASDHSARLLEPEEIQRYSADPTYDLSTSTAAAVDGKKHFCSGIFVGSTLTAYTFFATGKIDAAFNIGGYGYGGVGFDLPENALYWYKAFVLPEYRRKNQMVTAVQHGVSTLLPAGGWVVTTTDIKNHAAQGMFRKMGFVRKTKISEYRLLGFGYYSMPRSIQLGEVGEVDTTTVEIQAGPFRC